uniref:NADH-ubiquinone oxidoreductase chain 1 n=1 Tax=Pelagomacellicephala iliffei TaxID=1960706 RepID=A0A8E7MJN0_9ANNE|nr:NADH dehydrogenase subunit 1 [Pelagomacellicephala iliffei]
MIFPPFINITLTIIMALLCMAFFTLLERKILGYSQLRKGPNKVSISGIPQPLADAMKLLSKEQNKPSMSNLPLLLSAPIMALLLSLIMWMMYPSSTPTHFFIYGTLLILCISSLNVYTTLMAGWSSNSKYALMGALRSIAQTISYEVSMSLILLGALILLLTFDITLINLSQLSWIAFITPPSFMIWFTTMLAETNRTPFDLSEGESELVSGFNTEYSGGAFTLIFMSEYTNIIFMSLLTAIFFSGTLSYAPPNSIFLSLKTLFIAIMFLWIRSTYPRMRYDQLMNLTWKSFLPFSLSCLIFLTPLTSSI